MFADANGEGTISPRAQQRTKDNGQRTKGMSRYVVGIDLGTTNSALAYADAGESPEQPVPVARAADPAGRRRQ